MTLTMRQRRGAVAATATAYQHDALNENFFFFFFGIRVCGSMIVLPNREEATFTFHSRMGSIRQLSAWRIWD